MYIDRTDTDLRTLVRTLPEEELPLVCTELRERLIENISKTGGHLASNLGAVELTVALHRVFDTEKDRVVFDVGHQCYVHKMLTGRLDRMDTLRQLDGLSGFPKRSESKHDAYDSGHSSTSISAALGYAMARDLRGEDYACVAVIGDGALTGGVAYEALDNAGSLQTPLIVVLNDNQMSISQNTGGFTNHLQQLRTSRSYLDFKSNVKKALHEHPRLYEGAKRFRDSLRQRLTQNTIFEDLGFRYYGPVDGHDISALVQALSAAKASEHPVVVHVLTKKGKGFLSAEKNPSKYHGVGPFDPSLASPYPERNAGGYSELFGETLSQIAEEDASVVAISAAMVNATGLQELAMRAPSRVIDVGIAEQHAVSLAAGLALGGMKPVVAVYSTFLQRAYDQVLTEVCLQDLPVVFAIDRAGVTGRDGETHQGVFDLSYLSAMPNMTVLAPKDGPELAEMLRYALALGHPCAVRYPREKICDLSAYGRTPMDASPETLTGGESRYAILAAGSMVREALKAAELLKRGGIECAVCNVRRIKPLPTSFLETCGERYTKILTVEDGCLSGGFGSAVCEYYADKADRPEVLCLGWPDRFIEHGSIPELRSRYGLDASGIAKSAEAFFEGKA